MFMSLFGQWIEGEASRPNKLDLLPKELAAKNCLVSKLIEWTRLVKNAGSIFNLRNEVHWTHEEARQTFSGLAQLPRRARITCSLQSCPFEFPHEEVQTACSWKKFLRMDSIWYTSFHVISCHKILTVLVSLVAENQIRIIFRGVFHQFTKSSYDYGSRICSACLLGHRALQRDLL